MASKKILVHTCCAACAGYVFPQLLKSDLTPIAFFYNPAIEPTEEHEKRKDDLVKFCDINGIKLIMPEHKEAGFKDLIKPYKDKNNIKYITDPSRYRRKRCTMCNELVVSGTIKEVKKSKLKYFTTTLLCSPYKDHEEILNICNEKALSCGIIFYYQDFRKGYWSGRNYARTRSLYTPSYCGCSESLNEGRLE